MNLDLLGVFGAGVLTYVTPCVLPLIPIYLSALVGGDIRQLSAASRGQLIRRALLFSVGFIAVFTAMGLTASSIGGALIEHKALVEAGGALLILVFALKFLGVVRIPLFDRIVRANDSKVATRFGGVNALLMGVVFAAGWSPCVGPVLGSILTYTASATSNPLMGGVYLAVYGFGFALPLIVTAAFAEAGTKALRRLYPLLPRIEKAIGVLLLVVAGSMLWNVAPLLHSSAPPAGKLLAAAEAKPVMLELYAGDCTICKEMEPVVDRLEEQCAGAAVAIVKKDISLAENRHLVEQHRVLGVPTFVFLDEEGEEVARLIGRQSESSLRQSLAAVQGESCPDIGPVPGVRPREAAPAVAEEPLENARPEAACALPGAELPEGVTECTEPL